MGMRLGHILNAEALTVTQSSLSVQVMNAFGIVDGGKMQRSHILISKGGKVADAQIGVSSKESVPNALKFVESS